MLAGNITVGRVYFGGKKTPTEKRLVTRISSGKVTFTVIKPGRKVGNTRTTSLATFARWATRSDFRLTQFTQTKSFQKTLKTV